MIPAFSGGWLADPWRRFRVLRGFREIYQRPIRATATVTRPSASATAVRPAIRGVTYIRPVMHGDTRIDS